MPAIIIGADTHVGAAITAAIDARHREVRAFVSDLHAVPGLKELGIKTASGDVSDGSHVGAAARGCFSAIVVSSSAVDDRERSFSGSWQTTIASWAAALREAEVTRIIWITCPEIRSIPDSIRTASPEFAIVATDDRSPSSVADEVLRIDDLDEIAKV